MNPPVEVMETVLYARHLDAVRPFYAGLLGFRDISTNLPRGLAFRISDRAVLLIFDPSLTRLPHDLVPSHGATGEGHIAFRVAPGELHPWRERLAVAGVPIEREVAWPRGGQSLYIRDPAGNSVELVDGEIWPL